jgi:hypothetical protein
MQPPDQLIIIYSCRIINSTLIMAIMRNFDMTDYYKCWLYFNHYFDLVFRMFSLTPFLQ